MGSGPIKLAKTAEVVKTIGQMPARFGLRAPRFGVAYLIAAAATLAGRVALARRSCVPGARLLCEVNGVSVCDHRPRSRT